MDECDSKHVFQRLEVDKSNVSLAKEKQKIELLFSANVAKPQRMGASTQEQIENAVSQWISVINPMHQKNNIFFDR